MDTHPLSRQFGHTKLPPFFYRDDCHLLLPYTDLSFIAEWCLLAEDDSACMPDIMVVLYLMELKA
jgi:hypothetical protein